MSTVTVSRIGERLVAVKTAGPETGDTLRSEGRLLEMLDHPGLIQFVDLTDAGDTVVMRTAFAGADTWANRPVDDPFDRAAGIAAIAATLADLHARGVSHGALRSEHVIRGDHDRPVLCGLSRSRDDTDSARQADMVALADLVDDPQLVAGRPAVALATLADQIRTGRCEASDVVRIANDIAADGNREPTSAAPRSARRILVVVGALVLVVGGIIAVAVASQRSGPQRTTGPLAEVPMSDSAVAAASSPKTITPPSETTIEAHPVRGPVPEPAIAIDHGGRRYAVGREGDVLVVGDWDCDGDPTLALLRLDTGEIANFDRWPAPGGSVSAPASWVIESALDLSADNLDGCDRLRVHTTAGSRILDPEGPP